MRRSGVVLLGYLAVSVIYFGLPLAAHPGRDLVGTFPDSEIFVWSMAWWPHAILHWQNPIVTHAVWAPEGVNLAWTTTIPGLALLGAPVTLLAGPAVAFNVVAVVLPALAAWTAYLLCRYLTHSFWPSLAGGYLFGFSSYELGQTLGGHMHLTSVFALPLVALVLLRYVDGSLSGRRLALLLGVLLAFQLSFSTEVAVTLTVAIAIAIVGAFAFIPAARRRLVRLPLPLAGAYAVAAVLTSPLLAYALLHFQNLSINPPEAYPADVLNVVVPTRLTWLGWHWTERISGAFAGNLAENGAYLGLPCLAILAWLAWTKRRQTAARFLIAMIALGVVVELGTALHVDGHGHGFLPWAAVAHRFVFKNVLPVRFSVYVALGAAVGVAWWASSTPAPRWLRVLLPAAAVAAIVPHFWLGIWHFHPFRPAFFTDGTYRACLKPSDDVVGLPFPTWTDWMLWQAEAGFRFRLADGYLSTRIPDNVPDPRHLPFNIPGRGARPLIEWAKAQHATMIIVDGRPSASEWTGALEQTVHLNEIDGIYLYAMPGSSSPCAPSA